MAGVGSINDGEPEFQIAPMIDVLLVILVFFMMITCAQVLRVDKKITLPVSKNALKKETNRSETIINVRWDSETKKAAFVIDDRVFEDADSLIGILSAQRVAAAATKAKGDEIPYRAVIRGDRNCPAIHISHAMASCATAGISDISFSAVNKEN